MVSARHSRKKFVSVGGSSSSFLFISTYVYLLFIVKTNRNEIAYMHITEDFLGGVGGLISHVSQEGPKVKTIGILMMRHPATSLAPLFDNYTNCRPNANQ